MIHGWQQHLMEGDKMKKILIFLQVAYLRFTLRSPAIANVIGGLCLSVAAFAAKMGDFSGVVVWKFITLQHLVVGAGVAGGTLSQYAVKNPEQLQARIDQLQGPKI